MKVEKRIEIERRIVRHTIRLMKSNGWACIEVNNGDDWESVRTEAEAMEHAFAADTAYIRFKKGGTVQWIFIVLGNDGHDVINDYSIRDPEFDGLMNVVEDYCNAICEKECS